MKTKKKITIKSIVPINDSPIVSTNIKKLYSVRCFLEGKEISFSKIKKVLENDIANIDEIYIFGISKKLYKEIIEFLNMNGIRYIIYYRSRIEILH